MLCDTSKDAFCWSSFGHESSTVFTALSFVPSLTLSTPHRPCLQYFWRTSRLFFSFLLLLSRTAYNPKSSDHVRKKYKKKLMRYEEECELIGYLGKEMTTSYREPEDRPIDFDHKLTNFLALRGMEPNMTWCAWHSYAPLSRNRAYEDVEMEEDIYIFSLRLADQSKTCWILYRFLLCKYGQFACIA